MNSEWIPLISGFCNMEFLNNPVLSIGLSTIFIVAIVFAMYCIVYRTNAIQIGATILLFLLLLLSNSGSFHFSSIYPALLCITWMQFCFLNTQTYVAFLLLSLGSLFFAPVVWTFPFVLILVALYTPENILRTIVKSIGGFITPYIYLLFLRWIAYDDAHIFLEHFANEITEIGLPFHMFHLTDYFLIIVTLYLVCRSIYFVFSTTPDGLPSHILKIEMLSLFVLILLSLLFFNTKDTPVINFTALPIAVILSYYYKNHKKKGRVKVEFIVLAIAMLMCSLYNVIN